MRRLTRALPVALLLLSAPALAQDLRMLEGLFNSVNSFTLAMHGGTVSGSRELSGTCGPLGLCGMGTEVYIDLPAPDAILLELALGTSYTRGFRARERSLDLYGAVRSFPTIAIYATKRTLAGSDALKPYAGVSFGFSDLWNVRAYDADGAQYELNGQTYDYGVSLGVHSRPGAFLEAAYKRRDFASLHWSFPPGVDRLPAGWPRQLDMSGWMLSAGWQITLTRESAPAASAAAHD